MTTARDSIVDFLTSQVFGSRAPLPGSIALPPINPDGTVDIPEGGEWQAFHDPATGFPIMQGISPEMVFGTGVIHSPDVSRTGNSSQVANVDSGQVDDEPEPEPEPEPDLTTANAAEVFLRDEPAQPGNLRDDGEVETFGIEKSQQKRPSAMGVTALVSSDFSSMLTFEFVGSSYEKFTANLPSGRHETWWRRQEHAEILEVDWSALEGKSGSLIALELKSGLRQFLKFRLRWRLTQSGHNEKKAIAITFVSEHLGESEPRDLFHFEMKCSLPSDAEFIPTPQLVNSESASPEDQEIEFLFRHRGSYGRGHGTATNWERSDDGAVRSISSISIPSFYQEVPETKIEGISLDMKSLASSNLGDVKASLGEILEHYDAWIADQENQIQSMPNEQQVVGGRLLKRVRHIRARIAHGIEVVTGDPEAFQAFQIMNAAMLMQQQNGRLPLREFKSIRPLAFEPVDRMAIAKDVGQWFPFQLGFILLTVSGIVDPTIDSREEVDLIFFPTGGGKTEAYLGVAAFSIILRRLRNSGHSGVDVLMRYTLRLLTVQQFERTAGLIAALETIRRASPSELGQAPISIGVWLGSGTTPNKRTDVVSLFNKAAQGRDENRETNPFILSRCPWCGAKFGLIKELRTLVGYRLTASGPKTLRFVCGDSTCDFSSEKDALPIWITDEDVYQERPSLVIGTVDKFARLTWVEEARSLFNIGTSGDRQGLPPELIIQDELHLISGPLGSMVGLYESVIEDLSSYTNEAGVRILPKIIASTATTRNYENQIRGLYGRNTVTLFPQAVERAGESFFASTAKDSDGNPKLGTRFLGIFPSTYLTGQLASSQVAAILSQAPTTWTGDKKAMDFYSTSLWFFNSLKELGQTLTLMQSTVVALLRGMKSERRVPFDKKRFLDPIIELTGRISSDEISRLLDRLKVEDGERDNVRTCLASSIMEVGVDVGRLGLLTILSQPKLTSQYIQVAGRVGRKREEGPGLVISLYNASRSRDRSVYENFMTFHERLYANVEPLSVTPFAIQTMEKALVGAVLAHYRMITPRGIPAAVPDLKKLEVSVGVLRERLLAMDPDVETVNFFESKLRNFTSTWQAYEPTKWEYSWSQLTEKSPADQDTALLRGNKEPIAEIEGDLSAFVPNSMRTVDGQTNLVLEANPYSFYLNEMGE